MPMSCPNVKLFSRKKEGKRAVCSFNLDLMGRMG